MKYFYFLTGIILIISSGFVTSDSDMDYSSVSEERIWDYNKINTAENAVYLSDFEKDVILEMNKARINPEAYADKYIRPLIEYYDRKLLKIPGEIPIKTKEGVKPARECYRFMKRAKPVGILYPSYGMSLGARDLANYQKRNGRTGHNGRHNSTVVDRIEKYGSWDIAAGENIAYGLSDAQLTVVSLLIDDGVKDRGHRHAMLDHRFKQTGVAFGPHKKYNHMCVITYAGKFNENSIEQD